MSAIFGLTLAAMLALSPAAPAAPPASGCGEAAAAGAAIEAARLRLAGIPLDGMPAKVTPEAQAAIEGAKDRVVEFLAAALRCTDAAAPGDIAAFLSTAGRAFADTRTYTAEDAGEDRHGNGLRYEVEAVPHHPDLLAVVARLAIQCGEDSVLVLFRRTGGTWRPLIVRRSEPYEEVSGAYGWLQYAVSPPDAQGRWYLATARITPWCTSAWQGLGYDLSRPGEAPGQPRIFFSRKVSTYLGYDDGAAITAEPTRFEVRHDGSIEDSDIIVRRHVESYAVEGEHVRRIQPVAFNVRDFADEWLASLWEEARHWSAPGVEAGHAEIRAAALETSLGYRAIRRCAHALHELAISAEGLAPWYVMVRGEGPYRLERVSRAKDRNCRGPDIKKAVDAAAGPS